MATASNEQISINTELALEKLKKLKDIQNTFIELKKGGGSTPLSANKIDTSIFYKKSNKSDDKMAENMNLLAKEIYTVLDKLDQLVAVSIKYIDGQREAFIQADSNG